MKKLVLIMITLLAPLGAMAQKGNFSNFYDKYSGKSGYTTVSITGDMLKMISSFAPDDELGSMLGGVNNIRIVMSDRSSGEFVDDLKKLNEGSNYRVMTSINDSGQNIVFYVKDKPGRSSGQISEFLMVVHGAGDNLAINITGDLDIKKISGLSRINIGGMDKLEHMKDE